MQNSVAILERKDLNEQPCLNHNYNVFKNLIYIILVCLNLLLGGEQLVQVRLHLLMCLDAMFGARGGLVDEKSAQ